MPYEMYNPNHRPPTPEEDLEINEAIQQRGTGPVDTGFIIQNRRVVMNDPVYDKYAEIAYRRADNELRGINMPMIRGLSGDFPNIDPVGKHCRVDMNFAQRATRLQSALTTCDSEVKKAVDHFLRLCKIPSSSLYDLSMRVDSACQEIQHADYASRTCEVPHVANTLAQQAVNIAQNDPDIRLMDRIYTAMEQVTGLKDGELDPQIVDLYGNMNRFAPLNKAMPTGDHVKRTSPEAVAVDFQNLDNIILHSTCVDPRNAEAVRRGRIPNEPTNVNALTDVVASYATATANSALDGLFSTLERFTKSDALSVHRATLTIVDGKTVSEHMQDIYNNLKPKPDEQKPKFDDWYAANLKSLSGEIVASALMAGKRVEAYIPGTDGMLPDQPTVLHKTGYEPTPLKPVTMTAWKRFFNRLGLYKKTAAQAKEYKAFSEARERMKATYAAAQNERISNAGALVKNMFFGDFMRQNNISGHKELVSLFGPNCPFTEGTMQRGSLIAPCVGMMAAMGHDIRDILDPSKLVQEKQDVGNLLMEKLLINRTLTQLTDPNANLTPLQRTKLREKLVDDVYQDANNRINKSQPKMSERLAERSVEYRQDLSAWAEVNQKLSYEESKELQQLQYQKKEAAKPPLTEKEKAELADLEKLAANGGRTRLTDKQKTRLAQLQRPEPLNNEQKQRLAKLSQHQEKWELWRELQKWQKDMEKYPEKAHQIRLSARQEAETLIDFLDEVERTPNFKLNMTDPRIPKCLHEGNAQWVGSVLFHGHRALNDQIEAIISGTDLKDMARRQSIMPVLSCAIQCVFDGLQDIKNDSVMLGYYRAANQSVMNTAVPDENTGELRAGDKSIEEATEALADRYLTAAYDLGNFIKHMEAGDVARAKLIQPYLEQRSFAANLGALLVEKEALKWISPDQTKPFSNRIPEATFTSTMDGDIRGAVVSLQDIGALADDRRPDAKMVLSGDLADCFDVTVEPEIRTTTSKNAQRFCIATDGSCHVIRLDQPATNTRCNATVAMHPGAEKKLGLGSNAQSSLPAKNL